MSTKQPSWEFIANLGDASPLDYGGYFVYRDKTGVYPEEAELLLLDDEGNKKSTYTIYRVLLEPLKLVDGHLVSAKYHSGWGLRRKGYLEWMPGMAEKYAEWFEKDLDAIASTMGTTKEELLEAFTSADPLERAEAYKMIGDYHGWENLDSDPLTGLTRSEVKKRYREELVRR